MSRRLLLLTALLAAPACTVPYPYSPYGPYGQASADGHAGAQTQAHGTATTVTEDGTVVVVVIDPAALAELTADAQRTGRTVVQLNVGTGGNAVRSGNDLALSNHHNDQLLSNLAAQETGEPVSSRQDIGWTRNSGNVSTVSNATPDKTERRPEPAVEATPQPIATVLPPSQPESTVTVSQPAPSVTVSEPVREKPQVAAVSEPQPTVEPQPTAEPQVVSEPEPAQPERTYRPVKGSSWWAPIGLVKKAKGNQ